MNQHSPISRAGDENWAEMTISENVTIWYEFLDHSLSEKIVGDSSCAQFQKKRNLGELGLGWSGCTGKGVTAYS